MVKLTGPALAKAASGTLGGALTFSTNKGRAYVKKNTKPKQPRTGPQVGMRLIMAFLARNWVMVHSDRQNTWNENAGKSNISPFNAYVRENQERWRRQQTPSQTFPVPGGGTHGNMGGLTVTGRTNSIDVHYWAGTINEMWACAVHHVTAAGVKGKWKDVCHIQPWYCIGPVDFTIHGFKPGLVWLAFHRFFVTGDNKPIPEYKSCTVI